MKLQDTLARLKALQSFAGESRGVCIDRDDRDALATAITILERLEPLRVNRPSDNTRNLALDTGKEGG